MDTDIVASTVRSRMMAGIRGADTRPEIVVRHGLHRRGFRYTLHSAGLPGKPDIVLPRWRAVVLVNGCFWHGHDCHLFRWPGSRREFWKQSSTRNRARDCEVKDALALYNGMACMCLVIWECALKGTREVASGGHVLEESTEWIRKGTRFPTK